MIDDTLYDAFGQRQVSTIFTQLNQYRVVLEVEPELPAGPRRARSDIYVRSSERRGRCRSASFTHVEPATTRARGQPPGPVPGGDAVVQPRARASRSATRSTPSIGGRARSACRRASAPSFQGTAQAFQASLANEPLLILAALVTVYIVLGVLYESYIHPITILSTLPSAGVGAILALLALPASELNVIALIGIILLIGIVKKNAIMMIDFALEAERKEGKSPEDAIYEACLLRFRPIMMTTMAALLGGAAARARHRHRLRAPPAARHHDRRRPAGRARC